MQLTRTRVHLINEVAYTKLRVAGTGQPLEPEYQDEIDQKIDPLILQLSVDEICHVGDINNIPGEWFDAIASLLANICAPLVGKPFSPDAQQYFERNLRRLVSTRPSYEVLAADYF